MLSTCKSLCNAVRAAYSSRRHDAASHASADVQAVIPYIEHYTSSANDNVRERALLRLMLVESSTGSGCNGEWSEALQWFCI